MKKNLLKLLGVILIGSSITKAQPYAFTQLTNNYANLPSPTVISTPNWDYTSVYTVSMPFTFNYFGTNFSTIYVTGGFSGFVYDGMGGFGSYEIYWFDNAMTDWSGNGTISYKTTGSAPNRIFKIQAANAGFESDVSEVDFANAQLWLYEGSNVVEMHYGSSSILDPDTWEVPGCDGPTVTIIKDPSSFVSLSGPSTNPSASSTVASLCVTGAPPLNKVYRFSPSGAVGIKDAVTNSSGLLITPNPNMGDFTIKSNTNDVYFITNELGQTIKTIELNALNNYEAKIENLETGIYFVIGKNNLLRSKIVITK
ncbi:MAG: T9SS type A sorting domain-containing protein [Bacteroidota bacterium]|nr:T9SS type A sorting domain-containing protein [Bacteroidota bacterium]